MFMKKPGFRPVYYIDQATVSDIASNRILSIHPHANCTKSWLWQTVKTLKNMFSAKLPNVKKPRQESQYQFHSAGARCGQTSSRDKPRHVGGRRMYHRNSKVGYKTVLNYLLFKSNSAEISRQHLPHTVVEVHKHLLDRHRWPVLAANKQLPKASFLKVQHQTETRLHDLFTHKLSKTLLFFFKS